MKISTTVSSGVAVSEFTIGDSGNYIDIDVSDNGEVLASLYVEVRDGRAVLVVSPAIVSRDSDEATMVVDLLTGSIDVVEQQPQPVVGFSWTQWNAISNWVGHRLLKGRNS